MDKIVRYSLKAKIINGVHFTNYLPKWVCFKIIYLVSLFLYYKALLRWAHSSKWARKWWSVRCDHTWWSVRRDHTWWSARHFLPHLPIKPLLLFRSICTTKSLKWFTLSWVSLLKWTSVWYQKSFLFIFLIFFGFFFF